MDAGSIFAKTASGRQEMQARSGALDALQRRVLILIDGMRTVNELGAFVRPGELEGALARLLELGLVASEGASAPLPPPVAPGYAAQEAHQPVRAATSVPDFELVRDEAAQFIRRRLGEAAEPICAAVERTRSPEELRQMLRGVEVFVSQRLDAATAQGFARHFGALLL